MKPNKSSPDITLILANFVHSVRAQRIFPISFYLPKPKIENERVKSLKSRSISGKFDKGVSDRTIPLTEDYCHEEDCSEDCHREEHHKQIGTNQTKILLFILVLDNNSREDEAQGNAQLRLNGKRVVEGYVLLYLVAEHPDGGGGADLGGREPGGG